MDKGITLIWLMIIGTASAVTSKLTTVKPGNASLSVPQLIQEMKMEIQDLKDSLSRIQQSRAAGYDHSSFLAVRHSNQAVSPNGVVQFPVVKHNIGPRNYGYDEKISFFRCPHNGTYVFSVSISVVTTGKFHGYSIMKEGEVLGTAYTYNYNGYNACSATVTTPCNKGEDVWVANTQTETLTVESTAKQPHTHFTGYRIN